MKPSLNLRTKKENYKNCQVFRSRSTWTCRYSYCCWMFLIFGAKFFSLFVSNEILKLTWCRCIWFHSPHNGRIIFFRKWYAYFRYVKTENHIKLGNGDSTLTWSIFFKANIETTIDYQRGQYCDKFFSSWKQVFFSSWATKVDSGFWFLNLY